MEGFRFRTMSAKPVYVHLQPAVNPGCLRTHRKGQEPVGLSIHWQNHRNWINWMYSDICLICWKRCRKLITSIKMIQVFWIHICHGPGTSRNTVEFRKRRNELLWKHYHSSSFFTIRFLLHRLQKVLSEQENDSRKCNQNRNILSYFKFTIYISEVLGTVP